MDEIANCRKTFREDTQFSNISLNRGLEIPPTFQPCCSGLFKGKDDLRLNDLCPEEDQSNMVKTAAEFLIHHSSSYLRTVFPTCFSQLRSPHIRLIESFQISLCIYHWTLAKTPQVADRGLEPTLVYTNWWDVARIVEHLYSLYSQILCLHVFCIHYNCCM